MSPSLHIGTNSRVWVGVSWSWRRDGQIGPDPDLLLEQRIRQTLGHTRWQGQVGRVDEVSDDGHGHRRGMVTRADGGETG